MGLRQHATVAPPRAAVAAPRTDEESSGTAEAEAEAATGAATADEGYLVSVRSGSDGKTGVSVKVSVTPIAGETLEQAARRANAFAVAKMREIETILAEEQD